MAKSLQSWMAANGPNGRNIYSKNAGPKLIDLLQKASEVASNKVGLDDEIDLARALALRATTVWNAVIENEKVSDEAKTLAERIVRDSLDTVTRVVSVASKVKVVDEGMIPIAALQWVMGEVAAIIQDEVSETDENLAAIIIGRINGLKLPSDKNISTIMAGVGNPEQFL